MPLRALLKCVRVRLASPCSLLCSTRRCFCLLHELSIPQYYFLALTHPIFHFFFSSSYPRPTPFTKLYPLHLFNGWQEEKEQRQRQKQEQ
ncbi:hypothetical protein EDD21DRAFT_366720, partial [Dissophora ornata]